MIADIIFFRGAPGVGKSTLSHKIKPFFPGGVTIELDAFLKFFNSFKVGDPRRYPDALDCMCKTALEYLDKGYYPIFIISSMKYQRMIDHFLSKIKTSYSIITLIAENDVLDQQIDSRSVGFKDKNASHEVNENMKQYRLNNEQVIETTGKTGDEIFNEVKKLFNLENLDKGFTEEKISQPMIG